MKVILKQLDELQKKIFAIYLNRDYFEKTYSYEKSLHEFRLKIITSLLKLANANDYHNELFELVMDLGNLRYRILDHATFKICEKELIALSENLSLLLNGKISQFKESIVAFEKIYQTTLQVVIKNPIVFLIFIENLSAIEDLFIREKNV